jgi:hypothetical protein
LNRVFRTIFLTIAWTTVSAGEFLVIGTEKFQKMGMFATANQVLGHLYIYEHSSEVAGLLIDFDVFGLYYDPDRGPNWWSYYFEPICFGEQTNAQIKYPSKKQYYEAFEIRRKITRAQSAEIVKKYIHIKQPILDKVDQFVAQNFQGLFILGVHYRGTDKWTEAPRVSYDLVVEKINESIPLDREYRIFVATDETPFLEMIQENFPGRTIAIDAQRSSGNKGVHFSKKNCYKIGAEALIDSLLLSRCNLLIRTSSSLSLWSTYFNPEIPVILLNFNYRSKNSVEQE